MDTVDGATPVPVAVDTVDQSTRDRDAEFDRAYRNVHDRLLAIAQRQARDHDAAHDMVQAAAYKAFVRWRRPGKPIENLEAYLTACLLSACMDLHRWSKRQQRALQRLAATEIGFVESAHEPLLRAHEQGDVAVAFRQLPADCQEILELRVLRSIPVQQVAEQLFIAEGTVKSKCSRCLDQLGRLMSD